MTTLKEFGALLASASEDLTIIIWKQETGQSLKKIITDVVLTQLTIDNKAHLILGLNLQSELRAYDFGNGV